MSSLLVTGGTGFIGSHSVLSLKDRWTDVVILDNFSNSDKEVFLKLKKLSNLPLNLVNGDVRDEDQLLETFDKYKFSAVMHFAGVKSVGESVDHPIKYYENNVEGAITLIKVMQRFSVRRLVFSSTATVYGAPDYVPLDEGHPKRPNSPYARVKLHVEELLQDIVQSDPEWGVAILRYFNPVGAHESGLLGENPVGKPNNLMPLVAQVSLGIRADLEIYGCDYPTKDGTGVRDYVHIMDVADGHERALDYIILNRGIHSFNLGTGRGYSVLEVIDMYQKVSGKTIFPRFVDRRKGDVSAYYADAGKARKLLGWIPRRGLYEMCLSSWNFNKNKLHGKLSAAHFS